jgi:D-3-phosphoglycerate dehydrogenase
MLLPVLPSAWGLFKTTVRPTVHPNVLTPSHEQRRMARIAVTDGMDKKAVALLEKAGHEVVLEHYPPEVLLNGALAEFDAIVVRSATKLTDEVLRASEGKLKVIGRAGVGVDNIDLGTAGQLGVAVVNAPRASTQSVVELTLGHLLASIRHLPRSDRSIRAGKWEKSAMKGSELSGKALGLIGFGRIAQSVGQVAQAFGMVVHAYDPYLPPKIAKVQNTRLHKTVDALFANCTHVSVHCNLTDETYHLVNAARLSSMPQTGLDGTPCGNHLINCARGGIVDENAVNDALASGSLTSAALDVFEVEPVNPDHPLLQQEHFHGTPHIGASTLEAQARVGADIAANVMAVLAGEPCDFVVNKDLL